MLKIFNIALLSICTFCSCMEPAMAAKVLGVRTYRAPEYTRLVFDLDAPPQYQLETQSNPHRLVLSLKHSTLVGSLDKLTLANTPITNINSKQADEHDLQVELVLRGGVEPRSFTLSKNDQYGDRLVIDLYDVVAKKGPSSDTDYIDVDAIGTIAASVDKGGKRDIVVAVSAGHGGDDPGAIGYKRLQEKQVTLAISREVAALIDKKPGYKAVLVRDGDYYIGLRQHMKIAHDHNADLFIEIHADAADNKNARGATVYALSERGATSEQARRLADKENSADLIGGVGAGSFDTKDPVLASVLLDFSMKASVSSSLEIGQKLIESLDSVTHLRRRNVEQAAFVVLKSADIPSLLVESGYITNPDDAENLDSPAWRKQFASALVNGITQWFEDRPPHGTLISWRKDHGLDEQDSPGTYTVQSGDSLSQLAKQFQIPLAELKAANNLNSNTVQHGKVLKVPVKTPAKPAFKEHKIARGETLSNIASSYSVSLEVIRATNQLKSDNIRPGQVLKIPAS